MTTKEAESEVQIGCDFCDECPRTNDAKGCCEAEGITCPIGREGLVCLICGKLSPMKEEEDAEDGFIEDGWLWVDLTFKNHATLKFALCKDHRDQQPIPWLLKGAQ